MDPFSDARPRWLAGLCPCCGGELRDWEWDGTIHETEPVAEGVSLCGRCIGNDHHVTDGFLDNLLRSLVHHTDIPGSSHPAGTR